MSRRGILLGTLLVLASAALASAQAEATGRPEDSAQDRERTWSFESSALLEWLVEASQDDESQGRSQGLVGEWLVDWHWSQNERVRWFGRARARADAWDRLEPGQPEQDESSAGSRRALLADQAELELRELYVDIRGSRGSWRIGKQQIVWGQADGFKVLDVVNPQDFREFVLKEYERSRIPLWTVNWQRRLRVGTLQVLFLPDATYHREPSSEALFALPFTDEELAALIVGSTSEHSFERGPRERSSRFFSDAELGARWSWSKAGWDVSFNVLSHHNDLAVRRREVHTDPGGESLLRLTPVHDRQTLYGATLSTSWGSWTLRSELAHEDDRLFETVPVAGAPGDGTVRGSETSTVVGLDWYGLADQVVSGQVLVRLPEADVDLLRARRRRDVTLGWVASTPSRRLRLETFALYGIDDGDALLRAELQLRWRDRIEMIVGLDWFAGPDDSLLGHFDHRDRIRIGVRTAW